MQTLPLAPGDVAALADEFEGRPAEDLLIWAAERFPGPIVLT